jgi:hypothetical protein
MPIKNTFPSGKSVGGVSERAGAKAGESNLSATTPSRVVTDEGIPVFWKAALFAGRRRNEGLGRSARVTGILPWRECADDRGCPKGAEEGNVVGIRNQAYAPT